MALKVVNTESLDRVADAINAKSGTSGAIQFPDGFVEAIGAIQAGGGEDLSTVLAEQEELVAELKSIIAQKAKLGDAKLPSVVDGTVTELTAEDLAGVTKIRQYGLAHLSSLTRITLPDTLTLLYDYAFYKSKSKLVYVGISSLEKWLSIDVYGGGYTSSAYPFGADTVLYFNGQPATDIVIPASFTKVRNGAFYGYTKLNTVEVHLATISKDCFRGTGVTNVSLGGEVNTVGVQAFAECTNLVSIAIPKSVTKIDNYAFNSCSALTVVDLTAYGVNDELPTLGSSVFNLHSTTSFEIRVNSGVKARLAAMTNWSSLADDIVEVS